MKVLIDIGHPAHVHFFRHAMRILVEHGHEVRVCSRDKEFTLQLLDELGIHHYPLSALKKGGILALGHELITRNLALLRIIRTFRPDIMAAIGGTSIAQVGWLKRIPSLVFYDTENARLQNAITYPFASAVIVPSCYEAWLPRKRHIRYRGYHELSYLAPQYFRPDHQIALKNGLDEHRDTFFIRLVSWQANHDIGESGWNLKLTRQLVDHLSQWGKVLISSETALPDDLHSFSYQGNITQVHHVMAFCRLYIGESATMASESAVLGVPAIYAARTGRGYTNEQERRYGLVRNLHELDWQTLHDAIDDMLDMDPVVFEKRHRQLLDESIDVPEFICHCIETHPQPLMTYRKQEN